MAICLHDSYALHLTTCVISYVGYDNRSFLRDTATQIILILHDSGVVCKLTILDRELDHFSCPILLHDSNAVFTHKISCCQMQRITFM